MGMEGLQPGAMGGPPSIPNAVPVVPTPEEVLTLLRAAEESRRPEHARGMFVSATTGVRRAGLCAMRRLRDVDWERSTLTVARGVLDLPGEDVREIPTKNRRIRTVALDGTTLSMLQAQVDMMEQRARDLGSDRFLGSRTPISSYFRRLRERVGLEHLDFHYLRKFMETDGQDLGFLASAGGDPRRSRSVGRRQAQHRQRRRHGPSVGGGRGILARPWGR